jgi:ABC-type sugar transport system ATPase subunit
VAAATGESRHTLVLGVSDVTVDYPGTRALDSVSLEIHAGDVLAVVGANGSGKTTLLSVICGLRRPTRGHLFGPAGPVKLAGTRDALKHGITIVPQDPQLAGTLSCRENVLLGHPFSKFFGPKSRDEVDRLLRLALPNVDPAAPADSLKKADRAMLCLVMALHRHPRLLALDEPTAVLGESANRVIIEAIGGVRSTGGAVVLVSHRVKDVVQLATRVIGLVDGRVVFDSATGGLTPDDIVDKLAATHGLAADSAGAQMAASIAAPVGAHGVLLKLAEFATASGVKVDSFEVSSGQVFGVAGLAGSGRSRLLRGLAGIGGRHRGDYFLDSQRVKPHDRPILHRGIGFVPEDRFADALFPTLSTASNLTITNYVANRPVLGLANLRVERKMAAELVLRFGIRAPSLNTLITALSGGNQQRTVLARTFAARPLLLLADEPTQGVDRRGRADIHALIRGYADLGGAVVMVSSEFEELLELCDRVLVMRDGVAVANLKASDTNYRALIALTSGVVAGHLATEPSAVS